MQTDEPAEVSVKSRVETTTQVRFRSRSDPIRFGPTGLRSVSIARSPLVSYHPELASFTRASSRPSGALAAHCGWCASPFSISCKTAFGSRDAHLTGSMAQSPGHECGSSFCQCACAHIGLLRRLSLGGPARP